MSTVSALPSGELIGAVKGAPETIKTMLTVVPEHYDETYKWFTRRGSRVLALGFKQMSALPAAAVRKFPSTPERPTPDLCTDQQTDPKRDRERPHFRWFPRLSLPLKSGCC